MPVTKVCTDTRYESDTATKTIAWLLSKELIET